MSAIPTKSSPIPTVYISPYSWIIQDERVFAKIHGWDYPRIASDTHLCRWYRKKEKEWGIAAKEKMAREQEELEERRRWRVLHGMLLSNIAERCRMDD